MYSDITVEFEEFGNRNATAEVMDRMRRFGAMPNRGDEDQRPLPEAEQSQITIDAMFETISDLFADTCLESETADVLWSTVNVFQRKLDRVDAAFDQLGFDIRRALREQDGSEIKSHELEELEIRARATSDARDYFEGLRDRAAEVFAVTTGNPWMPARGSRTSQAGLTAAVVDSRDFLAAKERAKTQSMVPEGPKVVVVGGIDYDDHTLVWSVLDKARSRHPDMVLVHGGAPRGTDLIASRWAENRGISQVVYKPDWKRYGKNRAGFVRNDQMLALPPIGVLAFPGTGLTQNLVDKARKMGIPARQYA